MNRLVNKTVLITGASSGIGRSCAYYFAREKCKLILFARRIDRLSQIKCDLLSKDGDLDISVFQVDIRNQNEVENAINQFSVIDILINNAGLALGMNSVENTELDYDVVMDTNVKGLLHVTRPVLRIMKKQNSGHIINIGSVAGKQAYGLGSIYCASKHAVDAISKSLTMELINTPIKISQINPGLVETEFSKVRFQMDQARANQVYKGITPLEPDDVAEIIVFTASRPPNVQINDLTVYPSCQASAYHVDRK